MSLWRKRNVKHNEQKHDNLSNPLDRLHEENVRLGLYEIVYDLSIKSDDLSIKSEEAMREVQRLGQEIEQEPAAWYRDEDGIRIYYETKVWDDCTPLYTTPQQRTWVGLTEEERNHARQNITYSQLAMTISEWADAVQIETEQRLMEKNK